MDRKSIIGAALLCLTALIWGTAFVAQKSGLDHLEPCAFNGIRNLIGCVALLPCILFIDKLQGRRSSFFGACADSRSTLFKGGICCGVILAIASLLQQVGIGWTSVGKAGFITTLYIFIVPLIGLCFGKKVSRLLWFCVAAAIFGMYLLCFRGGGGLNKGDVVIFLCAIGFSFHILVIDYFAPKTDCVRMACIQFGTAGVLSLLIASFTEHITWSGITDACIPLLYAGVLSSGVAYTLQIVAQKYVHPVIASLLMSLESVFAALGGWIILGERLNGRELAGCAIIFAAVIIAQLSGNSQNEKG